MVTYTVAFGPVCSMLTTPLPAIRLWCFTAGTSAPFLSL